MLPLLDGLINSWATLLSTFLWHGRPEAELASVAGRAAQLTFLPSAWLIFRGRLWNQGMFASGVEKRQSPLRVATSACASWCVSLLGSGLAHGMLRSRWARRARYSITLVNWKDERSNAPASGRSCGPA